eukprot:1641572-Pyramimonas_sp.AAC.1
MIERRGECRRLRLFKYQAVWTSLDRAIVEIASEKSSYIFWKRPPTRKDRSGGKPGYEGDQADGGDAADGGEAFPDRGAEADDARDAELDLEGLLEDMLDMGTDGADIQLGDEESADEGA